MTMSRVKMPRKCWSLDLGGWYKIFALREVELSGLTMDTMCVHLETKDKVVTLSLPVSKAIPADEEPNALCDAPAEEGSCSAPSHPLSCH